MRTVVLGQVTLLLLVFGCGSERKLLEAPEPRGHAGTGGASGDGRAGAGTSFPTSGGAGGIGAVADRQVSTGGAGEPFAIACRFGELDYAQGEAVPSIDGCNVCTCGTEGIECSDRECQGQLSADGDPHDGDPFIACESYEDCPVVFDCICRDEDGDLECDQHCPSYSCVSGICVDSGSRPCSPEDTSACLENEFCDYSLADACGTVSRGFCSLIFSEWRCTQDASPTCGCDGVRYHNACIARAAGQSTSPTDNCD
jgi:hypothetical protein